VNCGEKHAANFDQCLVRKNYIEYRQQLIDKEKERRYNNIGGTQYSARTSTGRQGGKYVPAPLPPQNAWSSYGQNLASRMENNNNTNYRQKQYKTNNINKNNENSDLYSPMEIMNITNDIFSKLSNCKSKADQINVIIGIVSKYVFNLDG
jgi:hypothetical protein